jgi:signal transduction histidine kinase/streptogramin lyase
MWLGTFSGGINFVSRDADKFVDYRHTSSPLSLSNNSVLSIFEDSKDNLWIGTDGGGMDLFDVKKGIFTSYKHDPHNKNSIGGNHILDIFEDSDNGNLWLGTWGDGITVFNKEKNTFKHFAYDSSNPKGLPSPNVWTIAEDADKNIWIGTYGGGLCRYDRWNDNFVSYRNRAANPSGLSSDYINIVYADRKGNLWIGGNGFGLDLFNKKTNSFTHYSHEEHKNSISSNDILSITEDEAGNLWIGSGLGLNKMDVKTQQFTNYYIKDGLPGNTIASLLFDEKGNLWISTYNGLSRLNPATGSFKNFDASDGLQSNEFKLTSCYRTRSGRMYFGGINGFNGFFPDSIKEKKYEPPLVFTDFQIFNKQVPIGENNNGKSILQQSITATNALILSYDQSVITFEFASLNYVVQNKKQYSYMLEPFDKDWNNIGTKHTATYTNLDPGEYTFKVRGWNNEGRWSSNMASLKLTITPPVWLTWWFRITVFVCVIGGAISFYRFRINIIKAQKIKLQHKVNEQTSQLLKSTNEEQKARQEAEQANKYLEIKNKEMEQFAYIASHDLREPLRTTSSFIKLLQKHYQGKLDEKGDKYIHYILDASERMKVLIKNLLDFSRIGNKKELEVVDCNKILDEVLADLGIAISETGANITWERLPVINGYATELKQLFQNLITNAMKFRKKDTTPEINISVKKNEGYWQFAFKDNGIGIDEMDQEKIFVIFQRLHSQAEYEGSGIGLSHCKKIVELHKGALWVESKPGEGSTFYFTLPAPADIPQKETITVRG